MKQIPKSREVIKLDGEKCKINILILPNYAQVFFSWKSLRVVEKGVVVKVFFSQHTFFIELHLNQKGIPHKLFMKVCYIYHSA